jgi:hypothetical protein
LRLNTVLRRLRNQIVGDTVLRVEIERGRHLETATERDQDAVGDVVFGKAPLCSLRTIRVNMELGIVGLLLDTQIGDAVDMTKFAKVGML